MSDIEAYRTARWIKLRRRVIVAGLLLGTLNTVFAYVNILAIRSRGALQVLADQQAAYSETTIRYGRQCGAYVIGNFEGENLKRLWDPDDPGFDLTYPTDPRSQKSFHICFTDLPWDSPAAFYYLRRQIQGYLNVHEIAYAALVDNSVQNSKLCKQWPDFDESMRKKLIEKIISTKEIKTDDFEKSYPSLFYYYNNRICDFGKIRMFFRDHIDFALPLPQSKIDAWFGQKPPL